MHLLVGRLQKVHANTQLFILFNELPLSINIKLIHIHPNKYVHIKILYMSFNFVKVSFLTTFFPFIRMSGNPLHKGDSNKDCFVKTPAKSRDEGAHL